MLSVLKNNRLVFYLFFNLVSAELFGCFNSSDIKIIESNRNRLIIEFTPNYSKQKVFDQGSEKFDMIEFQNYISVAALKGRSFTGYPNLNQRSFLIGMPSLINNNVVILLSEYETITNINIPPVPRYQRQKDSLGTFAIYAKNNKIYNQNKYFPEEIAYLDKPGIAREYILANLIISPVQYNPVTRELKRYKKLRIQINFSNKNPANIINSITNNRSQDEPLQNSIINFTQAKNWKVKDASGIKKPLGQVVSSVLSTGDWYKLEIKEMGEGIYKIESKDLRAAGINLSSVDRSTIKIFGNGGEELPEEINSPRTSDLVECAIYVSGEPAGAFTDNDYILFFAKGPDGWKYNPANKKFSHYINHFSKSNYYFLTFGGSGKGKRMTTQVSLNNPNPFKPKSISGKYYIEPEVTNLKNSGREWLSIELKRDNDSFIPTIPKFDGLIGNMPISFRILCAARSNIYSTFSLEQNSRPVGRIIVYDAAGSDEYENYAQLSDVTEVIGITDSNNNTINLKLTYKPNDAADEGYLDWIEIFYPRSLKTTSDLITFNTPDTNSIIEYNVDGFSQNDIFVFNVSEHNDVKILSGSKGGNVKFQINANSGKVFSYYVVGKSGFKSISPLSKVDNSDLHGIVDGGDLIIITPKEFSDVAKIYKDYRENSRKNPLKTKVVNVESIYNEYSGGLTDPTALRDFVRYASDNYNIKPKYLLLFGDCKYDYKNNEPRISRKNLVPAYETKESLIEIDSYCTDDYYVRIIGNDYRDDLAVGRITASNVSEAKVAVDKIISYETNNYFGQWRNTFTVVADDWYSKTYGDQGAGFTNESEDVAENYIPLNFEKKKIYIVAYPTVFSSSGRIKPDVNQAIIEQINSGTLFINYIGHGSWNVWADESIFTSEVTPPSLHNKDKLAFIFAATCDFGRYDFTDKQSMAEILLLKDDGGIIGIFSATRSVEDLSNYFLDKEFLTSLFQYNNNNILSRIGDVIYNVKQTYMITNDNKFNLLGDPTIRLNAPQYIARIDSVNGKSIDSIIQLKTLGKVNLKGTIYKDRYTPWKDFTGKILITVNDASKNDTIIDGSNTFTFIQPGGVLYKGECSIKNGEFSSTFMIPKDISYGDNFGRIGLYFQGNETDGSGVYSNIRISGMDTSIKVDNDGPVINIYMNNRNFRSGDLINDNPKLIVDLYDENGINISGLGVGHQFEAFLDKNFNGINLYEYYKNNLDSYQEGTSEYEMKNISNGTHKLKVRAFDVFNNLSIKEIEFKVSRESALTIQNILNFPNPFSKSTKFTFQQNLDSPIDITIKIYTVAGRLIKTIREYGIVDSFVQIEWDGRDEDGDETANGVYLYKVITRTQDGKYNNESFGKLSVLK